MATAGVVLAQSEGLVPLEEVIRMLRQRYSGDKLDASMFERRGVMLYEIKWLTDDGRKLVFLVDAKNGNVLRTEGLR